MAEEGETKSCFNNGMIQATLIEDLRNILDQYPDDNQILKVTNQPLNIGTLNYILFEYTCVVYNL